MTNVFTRYQSRLERRTGMKIKSVLVGGGTEFDKEFIAYLEGQGITKLKGAPYRRHIPPMAERVHESINSGAKTLMLSSKLPRRYYSCAQAYLAYVHNRTVHSGHSKTPYEYIYGKNPRVDQLQPFGAVGFAFVPHEKRNKLEPVRERVRLLGFEDDDDTTKMRGYHVLCESDLTRLYAIDVIFDPNITATELNGNCVLDSDTIFSSISTHEDDEPEFILTDDSGSTQIDEISNIEDIPQFGRFFIIALILYITIRCCTRRIPKYQQYIRIVTKFH